MTEHPLTHWRRQNNLSMAEFGRHIGVQRSALSHYEARRRIPRPLIMEKIRKATGGAVSATDFYPTGEAAE